MFLTLTSLLHASVAQLIIEMIPDKSHMQYSYFHYKAESSGKYTIGRIDH